MSRLSKSIAQRLPSRAVVPGSCFLSSTSALLNIALAFGFTIFVVIYFTASFSGELDQTSKASQALPGLGADSSSFGQGSAQALCTTGLATPAGSLQIWYLGLKVHLQSLVMVVNLKFEGDFGLQLAARQ